MAEARANAEGMFRMLWDKRLVNLVPGKDEYCLSCHCSQLAKLDRGQA